LEFKKGAVMANNNQSDARQNQKSQASFGGNQKNSKNGSSNNGNKGSDKKYGSPASRDYDNNKTSK
jgi:hypothetical protein